MQTCVSMCSLCQFAYVFAQSLHIHTSYARILSCCALYSWQNPVKKSWPRCPACKTPIQEQSPGLQQAAAPQAGSIEVSSDLSRPTDLSRPILQPELTHSLLWTSSDDVTTAPAADAKSPLRDDQSNALVAANKIAQQAGFDLTCTTCNAPVRLCSHPRCPLCVGFPLLLFHITCIYLIEATESRICFVGLDRSRVNGHAAQHAEQRSNRQRSA